VVKYTFDQLILKKLQGWKCEEFIFVSILGHLDFLDSLGAPQMPPQSSYVGAERMALIVVTSSQRVRDGFLEAEKMIQAEAATVGLWVLGETKIFELCWDGYRPKHYGTVFLDQDWQNVVNQFAEAA
jgi:hypothetical protein